MCANCMAICHLYVDTLSVLEGAVQRGLDAQSSVYETLLSLRGMDSI